MLEGWILIEKRYKDGGFPGGTIDRPAYNTFQDQHDHVGLFLFDKLRHTLVSNT